MDEIEESVHTRIAGLVFLGVLVFGVVASFITLRDGTVGVAAGQSVSNGAWTATFQAAFEERLPTTEPALHLWSAARYRLFREGAPGVEVGRDGWLFTTEELAVTRGDAAAMDASLEYIAARVVDLRERGAIVVVAIVPAKARIYEANLPGYRLPEAVVPRYAEALTAIRRVPGAIVPDIAAAFERAAAASPDTPIYLRTDTHWTPTGAAIAAETIADAVAAQGATVTPTATFATQETGSVTVTGDLLRFLPLGRWRRALGFRDETIPRYETTAVGGSGGLFDDPVIPGALVGTSYSAGEAWNFAGFLKEALMVDLVNVAEEGRGPFEPMTAYLASETIRDYPPRLVVWEIPERYLTTLPPESDAHVTAK